MNLKKLLAVILAFVLIFSVFTGCGSSDLADFVSAYVTATPVEEEVEEEEVTAAASFDYDAAYATYDPDTVMLTVNGNDIVWSEYFYWLFNVVYVIEYYYGADFDWDDEYYNGISYRETVYSDTMEYIKLYHGIEAGAELLEVTLDEEDQEELAETLEADIEYYGCTTEEELWEYLESVYVTQDFYNFINEVTTLYQKCFNELYGENGENCSEDDVLEQAEADGYMQAKHILLLSTDEDGNDLDETELAEVYSTAEEILEMLDASDDPVALFDELIEMFNEDDGQDDFENGYLFLPGEMVDEFEEAVESLDEYEYSGIVESTYGYHIIMRVPVDADSVPMSYYSTYGDEYTLKYYMAWEMYESVLSGWEDNLEIEYSETYENMDLSEVFGVS